MTRTAEESIRFISREFDSAASVWLDADGFNVEIGSGPRNIWECAPTLEMALEQVIDRIEAETMRDLIADAAHRCGEVY